MTMTEVLHQKIHFYLNDREIFTTIPPEMTALNFIREQQGLTGEKESCGEGDCGSCTMALGRWEQDQFIYRAVTSCILPAVKLHGTHVITVEGLGTPKRLHLIQQKLLERHGTQCGYCTPGIVMSMFCLFSHYPQPSREQILAALEGNLCRCTGYQSILLAADDVAETMAGHLAEWRSLLWPDYLEAIQTKLKTEVKPMVAIKVEGEEDAPVKSYDIPGSTKALFELIHRYSADYKIVAGGTDLIVQANTNDEYYPHLIDITNIEEFHIILEQNNKILIGCAVTYAQLMESPLIQQKLPVLVEVFSQMASNQIRNIATLIGNVANGSSVGDGICALMGLDAKLVVLSEKSQRIVPLEQYYQGYRKTDLKAGEIIGYVEVPIQEGFCRFEKTSKRRTLDIATLSSFIQIKTNAKNEMTLCRIALGGFSAHTQLARKSMAFLLGKPLEASLVEPLTEIITDEFTFRSNVRGSAEYRKQLIGNHLRKHFKRIWG